MYQGEDRVRQVNAIYELANELAMSITSDIKDAYGSLETLARELADDWRNNPESDVPAWYDDHDHKLLIARLIRVL